MPPIVDVKPELQQRSVNIFDQPAVVPPVADDNIFAIPLKTDPQLSAADLLPTIPTLQPSSDPNIFSVKDIDMKKFVNDSDEFVGQVLGGAIGKVADVLARTNYASAKFADSLIGTAAKGFTQALKDGFAELTNPTERLSFSEVIHRNNPELAKVSPITTEIIGFLGDLTLDPLTYLSFGTGNAIKMLDRAGKEVSLSKKGTKTLKGLIDTASVGRALSPIPADVIRGTAERQMISLLESDPELIEKSYLRLGGRPVLGKQTQDVIKEVFEGFNDISSVSDRAQGVRRTIFPQVPTEDVSLKELFQRNLGISEKVVNRRTLREGEIETGRRAIDATLHQVFKNIPIEGRNRIVAAGHEIDQLTKQVSDSYQRPLTRAELLAIRRQQFNSKGLKPDEIAAYSRMVQDFEDVAQKEVAAGLLKGTRQNYFPRLYDAIENADAFKQAFGAFVSDNPNLVTRLNSSERRTFELIQEAQAAGLKPEMDAITVYATRMLDSKRKLANAAYQDDLLRMFGVDNVAHLPRRVQEDIRFIGESIYPKSMSEAAHKFWAKYDKYQNVFKTAATVARPSFGVKQAPANLSAMYAVEGAKVFKVLDPRSLTDAQMVMNASTGNVPLADLQKMVVASPLGDRYTGEDILKIFNEGNVLRGSQIGDVKFTRDVKGEIDRAQGLTAKHQALFGAKVGAKTADWANTFSKAVNWAHWPGHIEDLSRASMVINGLRIGHSPEMAVRLADKALFNYSEGLSSAEKRWIRRVVPFYSYQRFAVPLFLDVMKSNPGRVSNIAKTVDFSAKQITGFMRSLEKVNNGETLTPAERKIGTADYILEQPHAFNRLDENTLAVFNTFNNFALTDVMGTMELNDKGEIDVSRSVRKGALAQLTPWIKAPLELMLDKKLFTDQAMEETGKIGNLAWIGKMLPENVKKAIMWEDGISPATGRPTTYVNPRMIYVMQSAFPVLSEVFKMGNPDNTPTEKVMSLLFGVGTIKSDLRATAQQKTLDFKKKVSDQRSLIRRRARQERQLSFDKALRDYQDLADQMRKALDAPGLIRGHGDAALQQQLEEGQPQVAPAQESEPVTEP